MPEKRFILNINQEEQIWFHKLARANKTSVIKMIMDLLEKKSKDLGIPIPEKRSKRKTGKGTYNFLPREKFMKKIDLDLKQAKRLILSQERKVIESKYPTYFKLKEESYSTKKPNPRKILKEAFLERAKKEKRYYKGIYPCKLLEVYGDNKALVKWDCYALNCLGNAKVGYRNIEKGQKDIIVHIRLLHKKQKEIIRELYWVD